MQRRCVLASGNQGKLREFAQLLLPLNMQVIDQTSLGIASCPEPHLTFLENALEKARHASRGSGLPALADDSGICLPILNGSPGVLSARFAQTVEFQCNDDLSVDQRNNLALADSVSKQIALLRTDKARDASAGNITEGPTSEGNNSARRTIASSAPSLISSPTASPIDENQLRKAYYVCVLVYLRSATDPQPLIAQATWWGLFADQPRGSGGFGYDAHFYLPDHQCTVAQLPPEQKNQVSHRAQAMQQLLKQMQYAVD
jgi:XTP/dITP diphosphohydrolase